MFIKKLTSLFFLTSLFLLKPLPAAAADFNLSLSPPLLEIMIRPGKNYTQSYWLTNQSNSSRFIPMLIPIESGGLHGQPKMLLNPLHLIDQKQLNQAFNQYQSMTWFSLANLDVSLWQAFTLGQGEKKQLVLNLKIPPETEQKDYYFALVIFPLLPEKSNNLSSQSVVGGGIASNILITATQTGRLDQKLTIADFAIKKWCFLTSYCFNLADSFDLAEFTLIAENNGINMIKPVGTVSFVSGSETKQTTAVLPQNILANSRRQLKPASCPYEEAESCQNFVFAKTGFTMGKFTAIADLTAGDSQDQKQIVFYVLPIKALITISVLVLVFFIVKNTVNYFLKNSQENNS